MIISQAYAQSAGGGSDLTPLGTGLVVLLVLLVIFVATKLLVRMQDVKTPKPRPARTATGSEESRSRYCEKTVFLSYRRADAPDITGRLYDRLVREFGRSAVFKDIDAIPLGSEFRKHIAESLQRCEVFILILGKGWLGEGDNRRIDEAHDFVRLEIEGALSRDIPVIPVLVHGATMPSPSELPESIREIAYRQAIQLRSDPDFHKDADRIIDFLRSKL